MSGDSLTRLQARNAELEARIKRQAETLATLQHRTAIAEKAARDAWEFARMTLRTMNSRTGDK